MRKVLETYLMDTNEDHRGGNKRRQGGSHPAAGLRPLYRHGPAAV
jgi:hypothetical protein